MTFADLKKWIEMMKTEGNEPDIENMPLCFIDFEQTGKVVEACCGPLLTEENTIVLTN